MKMKIAGIALLLLAVFLPCIVQGADAPIPEGPYPVILKPGETFKVCLSGQIICPAIGAICDDLSVASPVETPDGLGFTAMGPGTTLCSASNPAGMRRVFSIEVRLPVKH
jgi:hypothetical protein